MMKNAETITSILKRNSPCPTLKGRLVEQAIESQRPSNVVVFGKCSAGLKAKSRKGAAEFWNEVRASASGYGATSRHNL